MQPSIEHRYTCVCRPVPTSGFQIRVTICPLTSTGRLTLSTLTQHRSLSRPAHVVVFWANQSAHGTYSARAHVSVFVSGSGCSGLPCLQHVVHSFLTPYMAQCFCVAIRLYHRQRDKQAPWTSDDPCVHAMQPLKSLRSMSSFHFIPLHFLSRYAALTRS